MVEKEVVVKETITHVGIFDFKGFYSYAYNWLKEEEYGVVEEKYAEKVAGGRDINVLWKASKKLSDYFKVEIGIIMDVKGLSDVEVEVDGKKKKMNKGSVWMEFKGVLVRDVGGKWDTTPFVRFIRDLYDKYIIHEKVDIMQTKVDSDVKSLKEHLKSYLELSGRR